MRRAAEVCILSGLLILAVSCGGATEEDAYSEEAAPASQAETAPAEAVANLEAKSGSSVEGEARFVAADGSVTLTLNVRNAPPGEHAFHVHAIGDCSAEDGTSAGGHWNPTDEDHGKWDQNPFHLGDVGNLMVGEDGNGTIQLSTTWWEIGTGEANDVVGKSVIVHAGADDFTTQPTGAAGGRIACGVIE